MIEGIPFKAGQDAEKERILKLIEIRMHTVKTLSKYSISENLVRQVVFELERLKTNILEGK